MSIQLPASLAAANREFARAYPGESGRRQPVHTVYGGAHLFKPDTFLKFGTLAQRALTEYAPFAGILAHVFDIPEKVAATVYPRVLEKLHIEPVEDFRVDFEDGYGVRPDAEEDAAVDAVAETVALCMERKSLPPFFGIRIKPLNEELKARSIRTLDRFLSALTQRTGGRLPDHFVITLPKITVPEQVRALVDALLGRFDQIRIEMMIETPQALLSLPRLWEEARGRCVALHFGAYDYMASLGMTAVNQTLLHPACDFARSTMLTSMAGTGVWFSDGANNVLPIPAHRGDALTAEQTAANRSAIHRAWESHYDTVRHALDSGFYQGWDLHPAQLVSRYAAVYTFFLERLEAASRRLRNFIAMAAQATMVGGVFDDAATGQGLLNYFLRAVNCGAVPEDEVPALTGLTLEELRSASFTAIVQSRAPEGSLPASAPNVRA
jgi:citrate lyase beta subunit